MVGMVPMKRLLSFRRSDIVDAYLLHESMEYVVLCSCYLHVV